MKTKNVSKQKRRVMQGMAACILVMVFMITAVPLAVFASPTTDVITENQYWAKFIYDDEVYAANPDEGYTKVGNLVTKVDEIPAVPEIPEQLEVGTPGDEGYIPYAPAVPAVPAVPATYEAYFVAPAAPAGKFLHWTSDGMDVINPGDVYTPADLGAIPEFRAVYDTTPDPVPTKFKATFSYPGADGSGVTLEQEATDVDVVTGKSFFLAANSDGIENFKHWYATDDAEKKWVVFPVEATGNMSFTACVDPACGETAPSEPGPGPDPTPEDPRVEPTSVDIMTGFDWKVNNAVIDPDDYVFKLKDVVELVFNIDLNKSAIPVIGGDFMKVQLPAIFIPETPVVDQLITNSDGEVFAKLNITTDGLLTLTMEKLVEERGDVKGSIYVGVIFDEKVIGEAREVEADFVYNEDTTLPYEVEFETVETKIEGSIQKNFLGVDDNKLYNPEGLNWSIVVNSLGEKIPAGATVKDEITGNATDRKHFLDVAESAVEVWELAANGDKVTKLDAGDDYTLVFGAGEDDEKLDFTITFTEGFEKAYGVFYKTFVAEQSINKDTAYANKGTFAFTYQNAKGENKNISISSNASYTAYYIPSIKKEGTLVKDAAGDYIQWTVYINQQDIEYNVTVTVNDILSTAADSTTSPKKTYGNHHLKGGIQLYELSLSGGNKPTVGTDDKWETLVKSGAITNHSSVADGATSFSFDLSLKGGGYQMKYRTYLDDKNIVATTYYKNTVNYTLESTKLEDSKELVVYANGLGPEFAKYVGTPDYVNKQVPWSLKIKTNSNNLIDAYILDTFAPPSLAGATMTLMPSSTMKHGYDLQVYEGTIAAGKVVSTNDYKLTVDSTAPGGFRIDFTTALKPNTEYNVAYKTSYTLPSELTEGDNTNYNEYLQYTNNASFKYKLVAGGTEYTKSGTKDFKVYERMYNSGQKRGTLELSNGRIKWEIWYAGDSDMNDMPVTLVDKLDAGLQIIDNTSFKVYRYTPDVTSTNSNQGTMKDQKQIQPNDKDYPYSKNIDADKGGFTINFTKGNSGYYVVYYTKIDAENMKTSYLNTATFTAGTGTSARTRTYTASVAVDASKAVWLKKTGGVTEQDPNTVSWTVTLNQSKLLLNNAVVTDTMGAGQDIRTSKSNASDPDADYPIVNVKVGTSPLEMWTDYTVSTVTRDGAWRTTFTINFLVPINDVVTITYACDVDPIHMEQGRKPNFENGATLSGNGQQIAELPPQKADVKATYSGGSMSGATGSVVITKQDAADPRITLEGMVFEIYKVGDTKPLITDVTGADGTRKVEGLVPGNYYVLEKTPPDGYFKATVNRKDFTIPKVGIETSVYVTFTNDKIHELTVYKTDTLNNDLGLSGAVFTVYQNSAVVGTITTDESGYGSIELKAGTYYVEETTAPAGYALSGTAKWVTLPGEDEEITLTFENDKYYGFEVFKADADEPNTGLAGAVFTVYEGDTDTVVDTITVDENGRGSSKPLLAGTYTVQETTAPSGYYLDATPQTVTLPEDDGILLTFLNEPITEDPPPEDPPPTDPPPTDPPPTDPPPTLRIIPPPTPPITTPPTGPTFDPPAPPVVERSSRMNYIDPPNPITGVGAHWSLLNLMCAVFCGITSVLMITMMLVNKLKSRSETEEEAAAMEQGLEYEEDRDETVKRRGAFAWRVAGGVLAVAAMICFLITENVRNPMVWVCEWSPMYVTFAVGQVLVMLGLRQNMRKPDEEFDEEELSNA